VNLFIFGQMQPATELRMCHAANSEISLQNRLADRILGMCYYVGLYV